MAKKVLVVEDDADNRSLVKKCLVKDGYEVVESMTGVEALEIMKSNAPDLVVLDLILPGLAGLEVCKTMRASDRLRSVPVIVITSQNDHATHQLATDAGANEFIGKPFSTKDFRHVVGKYLAV